MLVVSVQGACSAVNAIAFGLDIRVGVWCIGANGGLVLAPLVGKRQNPLLLMGRTAHQPFVAALCFVCRRHVNHWLDLDIACQFAVDGMSLICWRALA